MAKQQTWIALQPFYQNIQKTPTLLRGLTIVRGIQIF